MLRRGLTCRSSAIDLASGCVAGATRYMEIRPAHRGLEIGGTWYGAAYRRTRVNTECKYLLLEHAFENLGCIRVQLKTDSRNERSQRAIERLGAVKEGDAAKSYDTAGWARASLRLLQHTGFRVADGKATIAANAGQVEPAGPRVVLMHYSAPSSSARSRQ